MANPSKSSKSDTAIVDLFNEEKELQQKLLEIRQKRSELARQQAGEIRKQVADSLEKIVALINPLVEQDAWTWRTPEFDDVLQDLDLLPREARAVVVPEDKQKSIVDAVKSSPDGMDIKKIADMLRLKPTSIARFMPILVEQKLLKVRPDGRRNIYYVD